MKKKALLTLSGVVCLLIGVVAFNLYKHYPQQIILAEPKPGNKPYGIFVEEAQVNNLQNKVTTINQQNVKASAPLQATKQAVESETSEIPEMSLELQHFIATSQPEKIIDFFAQARRDRAQKIQAIMKGEASDSQWQDQLVQYFSLSENLVPQLKGVMLVATDCRESICSMEVDYGQNVKNYKQIEPYMANIGNVLGLEAWVHHDALPHGGVIYFARQDGKLPEMAKI